MIDLEREACQARLAHLPDQRLLLVQDPTSFNFAHHSHTRGLGVIEDNRSAGFFAHTSLAVSLQGVPLGLLDQQVWARPVGERTKANAHQASPISEKESSKWLHGLLNSLPDDHAYAVITVCDREADIYELFQTAKNTGTQFIVRAVRNRRLEGGDLLYEQVQALSPAAQYAIELSSRRGAELRHAQVEVRYALVTLLPPKNRTSHNRSMPLQPLPVQVVEVREIQAPEGVEALHWLLLTNVAIRNLDEAQTVLRYYSHRWLVERFHYIVKSGCEFEDSQLKSWEALSRFLGLCSGVAWRLLWMTYQARQTPEASCELILGESEWQALAAYMQQSPQPPHQAPRLGQAIAWIAQLGGFIGRKGDGEPGVKVLWRGWEDFQTIHDAWLIFHPPHPSQDVGKA
jgi:hypothetical protein